MPLVLAAAVFVVFLVMAIAPLIAQSEPTDSKEDP